MRGPLSWRLAAGSLLVAGGTVLSGSLAYAQEPVPVPATPSPTPPDPIPASPTPAPAPASVPEAAPLPAPSREEVLEDRIRQLEATVQKLADQAKNAPTAPKAGSADYPATDDQGRPIPGAGPPSSGGTNTPAGGTTNPNARYRNNTGAIAPGQGTPSNPPPSARFNMPAPAPNFPGNWRFGPGFEFRTPDDEFVLQFHNLTQVDYRGHEQGGQATVKDEFVIPRQWFMFSGRLQKPYEYFVSIQNVFDTVNMLDVFMNIHYDDRLQFKFGRYKTPFTYEFYALPIQGLINPERSLFFNNFGLNRELGLDAWGQLFNRSLDYAVGIFNTSRNGYVDTADGKAVLGFVNWRPFKEWTDSPLETFNVGGSVMAANASGIANPVTLRTQVATAGNQTLGIPFLTFNNNTREVGQRTLWDLHAAYYYKQLSLVAEWQSGFQSYALTSNLAERTRVPIESYYVQAGYFLTGETVSGRNVVKPLHDFDLRPGFRGSGAVELTARYNYLTLGNQVFAGGFSDPNQYTRSLYLTDVGVNWYWTQQVKWMFQWEHAAFGTPVIFAPGRFQTTSDTFWARLQVFF